MCPLASLALLAGALSTTSSSADTVHLHLGACVPERDLVHDLVGIEIGFDRLVETDALFEVYVTCEGSILNLHLSPNPFGIEARRVSADDLHEGGSRLVALNVVELIQDGAKAPRERAPSERSAETVARASPEQAPQTRTRSAERAERAETAERAPQTRLGASPTLRLLPKPGRLAIGARASFGIDSGARRLDRRHAPGGRRLRAVRRRGDAGDHPDARVLGRSVGGNAHRPRARVRALRAARASRRMGLDRGPEHRHDARADGLG